MKKIAILTFHYSENFGAVLQTFSLFRYLIDKGYKVEVIDFVPQTYNFFRIMIDNISIKYYLKKMLSFQSFYFFIKGVFLFLFFYNKRKSKFTDFRTNHLILSQRANEKNISRILNQYSHIIVGSDQIWNSYERKKPNYFLDFETLDNTVKISYAADSTNDEVTQIEILKLKPLLSKFNYISVRNKHTYNFVYKILGVKPMIVNDPTLLLSQISYFKDLKVKRSEFVLIYILGQYNKEFINNLISKVRQKYIEYKCVVIYTSSSNLAFIQKNDTVKYNLSPLEWINLIYNSKFVLTDSFHGLIYSLKFKKPFLAFYNDLNRSHRFKDISDRFDLQDFIIGDFSNKNLDNALNKKPNFNEIHNKISANNINSEFFLSEALGVGK